MAARVFVGLGSNLDNPLKQLNDAVLAIRQLPQTHCHKVSSVYVTSPMGPKDQPDYMNAVVELETTLAVETLLMHLQAIEDEQGRKRDGSRWRARTLDLDILLYSNDCIDTPMLTVPHRGCHERAFVLYPLQELDAELQIPGKGDLASLIKQNLDGEVLQKLDINLCPS